MQALVQGHVETKDITFIEQVNGSLFKFSKEGELKKYANRFIILFVANRFSACIYVCVLVHCVDYKLITAGILIPQLSLILR